MNYESYQETDYMLKKKSSEGNNILQLHKFENITKNIGTPLSPVMWDESMDKGLIDGELIDMTTGEIICQWNKDYITYISEDYDVHMTQHHFVTFCESQIREHNNFIINRMEV